MPALITAGLSQQAYRLQRILNSQDVIYADISALPFIPGRRGLIIPSYHSMSFTHEILKICLDHRIDRVFPLVYGEITELSKARLLFSEYNISLVIPSNRWLENNPSTSVSHISEMAVLENGSLIAGTLPPEPGLESEETGVFCWATYGREIQYSLYLA
jgi:hypothetical protein